MNQNQVDELEKCVRNAAVYQTGIREMMDYIHECRKILVKCAERFREYEQLHTAKIANRINHDIDDFTVEDLEILAKIKKNREMAEMCEETLK